MSLADSMNFVAKAPASSHRTYRVQVAPLTGTTAVAGDKISFDVPTGNGRRNVFLDASESFVTFTLKNLAAGNLNVDSTAYSLFDSLTTVAGGNVLEQISDYGSFVNTLIDAQMNNQDVMCAGSVYLGSTYSATGNVDKTGRQLAQNAVLDCALPLVGSGIFSGAASRHIPVGAMSDLRLELVMASAASGVVAAAASNYRIENVTLNLTYTEIDGAMAEQIAAATGGVYRVSTEGWRVYSTVTAANRTADSILIPARFSSVKTLGAYFRLNADVVAQAQYSQSNRVNPLYSATGVKCSAQFQVGSALLPQQPLSNQSEIYQMLRQAFHALGDVSSAGRIQITSWINAAQTAAADVIGTFVLAVNADQIIGKNSSMTSGFSTLSSPVVLALTYPADPAASHRVNTFAHYDAVLEVGPDGVFMRY
jgi:hypothetical protein